jgi:SAM-dependent methyltransferase
MSEEKSRYWNEKYLAGATGWDRGAPSPALREWLEGGELAPGRVLIPGCGRGHEAVELARRGFAVTALDIAAAPLARLKAELDAAGVSAELIQADVLHWRPAVPYDAVYEQTCLCALPPQEWPVYAEQLRRWLRPGGRLFALFMQTGRAGGPPFHCALGDMRALFPAERWAWGADTHAEVPHPNGLFEYAAVLTRLDAERA